MHLRSVSCQESFFRTLLGMLPVDVEQLKARAIEVLMHLVEKALDQLVAQVVVGFALRAQAISVELDRAHLLDRARVELPLVGRIEPRPSQDLARVDGLNPVRAAAGYVDLQRNPAGPDQVRSIGFIALPEQKLAGVKADVRCASGQKLQVPFGETAQEAMLAQDRQQRLGFDGRTPCDAYSRAARRSVARMAATSSVISIPTGHHEMQRPHPTHPEVPN